MSLQSLNWAPSTYFFITFFLHKLKAGALRTAQNRRKKCAKTPYSGTSQQYGNNLATVNQHVKRLSITEEQMSIQMQTKSTACALRLKVRAQLNVSLISSLKGSGRDRKKERKKEMQTGALFFLAQVNNFPKIILAHQITNEFVMPWIKYMNGYLISMRWQIFRKIWKNNMQYADMQVFQKRQNFSLAKDYSSQSSYRGAHKKKNTFVASYRCQWFQGQN